MPTIVLSTRIAAAVDRCFDLARSVDLHLHSMHRSKERAIAGVTSGLLEQGQQVTWEGRHFGLRFRLTSRITQYRRPAYFQDSMVSGPFQELVHDHHFESIEGGTYMRDQLVFRSPLGPIGRLVDHLVLTLYLKRLLKERNATLKRVAEQRDQGSAA